MLVFKSLFPISNIRKRVVCLSDHNIFEISVVAQDKDWAAERIENAVTEIGKALNLVSIADEGSQVNEINRNAGVRPVKVDADLYNLVNRSLKISELTHGAFDITYNSPDNSFWGRGITTLPDTETAKKAVQFVDYRNVVLDVKHGTVFLKQKGMRIDLNSIAKGYATDRAKYSLQMQGVGSGVVNAFGDMITWGNQPNGQPWTISVADPGQKLAFSDLNISNMAISTSGNNEKYSLIDGKKYTHTLNPKTGLPLRRIKSVCVMSPSAELAAAMATPVKVMGVKLSLNLFNSLNQLVCVIENERKKVYASKSINLMMC